MVNNGNRHQASGKLLVDGFSNNSLSEIVDLYGQRRQNIFGQVYLEASKMDVSPWLTQLISEHVSLESTEASFKVWGNVKDGLVDDIIIDVAESGIRWQKEHDQECSSRIYRARTCREGLCNWNRQWRLSIFRSYRRLFGVDFSS